MSSRTIESASDQQFTIRGDRRMMAEILYALAQHQKAMTQNAKRQDIQKFIDAAEADADYTGEVWRAVVDQLPVEYFGQNV